MANCVLILGESGTGKSTSIRNLDPKETCIINVIGKSLPFKGWKGGYTLCTKDNSDGNMAVTDKAESIIKMLKYFAKRETVHHIVIDDFQYLLANEYMRRAKEKSYDKFVDIGQNAWMVINEAQQLRKETNGLNVYIMAHVDRDSTGHEKIKTIGKMLDEKITVEGLFSVVLYTVRDENGYHFLTQNNGNNTCKSPLGMFNDTLIDNDLALVAEAIRNYEI